MGLVDSRFEVTEVPGAIELCVADVRDRVAIA